MLVGEIGHDFFLSFFFFTKNVYMYTHICNIEIINIQQAADISGGRTGCVILQFLM